MGTDTQAPADVDAQKNGHGDPADAEAAVEQGLVMQGTGEQLSLSIGGKRPTDSSLRLLGGKITVDGEFKKGDVIEFHGTAVVGFVGAQDKEDSKTGQVVGCERQHRARILELHAG